MALTGIARPNPRAAKDSKGIHYVVFKEKAKDGSNEWDQVVKFWGTDSPATIGDDILAAVKNAPKELEAAIRAAYKSTAPAK